MIHPLPNRGRGFSGRFDKSTIKNTRQQSSILRIYVVLAKQSNPKLFASKCIFNFRTL